MRKDARGKRLDAVLLPWLPEAKAAFTKATKVGFEDKGEADDDGVVDQPWDNQF